MSKHEDTRNNLGKRNSRPSGRNSPGQFEEQQGAPGLKWSEQVKEGVRGEGVVVVGGYIRGRKS